MFDFFSVTFYHSIDKAIKFVYIYFIIYDLDKGKKKTISMVSW